MSKREKFLPILFCILSLLPLIDLLHPGLPLTHDGRDHVARIANFYLDLQQGIFIPRWAENLNWGYGHPILMFLYPLPSYLASLLHFSGFGLVDSVKIVFALGFLLSGLAMYLWLHRFVPKPAAFLGALFYTIAPYRLVDLYVRGDIGENLAFIFPPLVLYFLYTIWITLQMNYNGKNKLQTIRKTFVNARIDITLGALSFCGLILSHNAMALMFVPIILLYAFYLFWDSKQKKYFIFSVISLLLLGFCLSAFFWIPALFEGKYTLRNIVTKGDYVGNFVSLTRLLYGKWSYGISGEFSVQIGILQLLAMVLSLPALWYCMKRKHTYWQILTGCWIFFLAAIFLMLPISSFIWARVTLLQNFQFPWRFLAVTVLATAVSGAVTISLLPKRILLIMTLIITAMVFLLNNSYWHANGYLLKPEQFYTGIYAGTTDTGESSPIWSVRFMEKRPSAHLEVLSGSAKIIEQKRTPIQHIYIVTVSKTTEFRENTLYFPGWKVVIDGKNTPIQFQDPDNRGVMTFLVLPGKHTISVIFTETKLRAFADFISLIAICLIVVWIVLPFFRKQLSFML